MPEPDRELLVLRLVEDRSYREIAVRMNCTSVVARRRFSRSFRRLQLTLRRSAIMTTELPSALKLYRGELRDAIERDLDLKARHSRVP